MLIRKNTCTNIIMECLFVFLLVFSCQSQATEENYPQERELLNKVANRIQKPEMRKLWLDAYSKGNLPSLTKIPIPSSPVSQRKPMVIKVSAHDTRRPVISNTTRIDVQPYSRTVLHRYTGKFHVTKHESGEITGKLNGEEPFSLLYKFPGTSMSNRLKTPGEYNLFYIDDVKESAHQQRIILSNPDNNKIILASISEGSWKPYITSIKELGVTIQQHKEGNNPAVTLRYGNKSVMLQQGEQKEMNVGGSNMNVYLVTSIHKPFSNETAYEGQPYYVKLFLYQ